MSVYEKIKTLDTEEFQRHVGICQEIFLALLTKVSNYILSQQEKQPMKKRGRKSSISLADQLLLTLTYMRHYSTFAKLGLEFSISEGVDLAGFQRTDNDTDFVQRLDLNQFAGKAFFLSNLVGHIMERRAGLSDAEGPRLQFCRCRDSRVEGFFRHQDHLAVDAFFFMQRAADDLDGAFLVLNTTFCILGIRLSTAEL